MIHDLVARAASAAPDAPALVMQDGQIISYADHWARVQSLAEDLQARGLNPRDRLLIVAENAAETVALIFAASCAGAVAVPVNARMTGTELARIATHAAPRLIAYTTAISPDAAAHAAAADVPTIHTAAGPIALRDIPEADGPAPHPDTAVILYTTGTTGDPKGVMLTHANLTFAGQASVTLRGMTADDLIYAVLPMTHVFGLASMLMAANTVGAAIRLEARFSAPALLSALQNGITVFPGVPQMHAQLMALVAGQGRDGMGDMALRYVSSGGAPLDPAWKRKAEEFYGLPLQNGYGMTESTAGISATNAPIGLADVSCGPALPGVELMLDTTVPAATDPGVGEVLTRGPHVMAGYYRNPEATAQTMTGDWLRTGDLGLIDENDCLHIVGRTKELIIRGGFNVYPPEVEAALNDHPAVTQSAVLGRRLVGGDEEILGFVQCADPTALDPTELRSFVAERLAAYKRPNRIIIARTLPAAPSGKILKHKLIETFHDQLGDASPR